MSRRNHFGWRPGVIAILAAMAVSAGWIFSAGDTEQYDFQAKAQAALRRPSGFAQLVSIEPMPAAATPEGAFIGVWSIRDHGDVPARWKIGGPKSTIERPRGVALNPRTKEIIVADMRLNSVLTYYFPEIF